MKKLAVILGATALMHNHLHSCNRFTEEDLENEANNLSSFGGGMGYVGQNDDFLDFAGNAASFAEIAKEAKPFTFTLTNANAATRTVLIAPGLIATQAGLMATGAFNDKNGAAGLSAASGSPGSIEEFVAHYRLFPSLVSGFKISTDSVTQMEQSMTIMKKSPFNQHSSMIIPIGTYASEQNFNTKILSIPKSFFLDPQTLIEYPILGETSVSFTFMITTSLNIAKALRDKTAKAKTTLSMGGNRFIG
ncbi:MAG: hypothetical protein H7Y13_02340 [Sphingobacteriaceae bacterium]|nr:hypothetical protein [Sphingobacteriaceae bacterium]